MENRLSTEQEEKNNQETLETVLQEVYNTLVDMPPNAQADFLKELETKFYNQLTERLHEARAQAEIKERELDTFVKTLNKQ